MEEQRNDLDLGGAGEAEDPLAGIEADPGVAGDPIQDVSEGPEEARLGGDGAAIGEEPVEGVLEDPEAEAFEQEEELFAPEPEPEPEQAAAAQAEVPEPEPEPAPEPEPEPKAEAPRKRKKAAKTPLRAYVVLQEVEANKFDVAIPKGVKARNGRDAMKAAYKELASTGNEKLTLVCVPTGYWKPKSVQGRKREDYAIDIG